MVSDIHQSLLQWAIRKMTFDGFLMIGCDGSVPQGGDWNRLPAPPEIARLRPDACGVDPDTGHFAFGEAKTFSDIDTEHTRRQLRTFARLVHRADGATCRLYVAIPRSAARILDRVLVGTGLFGARNVVRLHIPDCLVGETKHGQD